MRRPRAADTDRHGRFTARDLFAEASYGIGARPARLFLTVLGTILGIASVVVTVGMAQTASGQIARQFDAVAATQVVISPGTTQSQSGERATARLPWDSVERVEQLNGVVAAALVGGVGIDGSDIRSVPIVDPEAAAMAVPPVLAASPELLPAIRGELATGRVFDVGHSERADRVVLLGARAAERLNINRVDSQPSIFIGERAYTVIGIIETAARRTDVLDSVIMPIGTARADFDLASPEQLQVQIEIGAGPLVSRQAPIALSPNAPENFTVQAPSTGSSLRENVQADVNAIFLALGAVALLVGGLGIANVTLLSVMERVGEIGLRRALGATRRQIAGQFIVESVTIGLIGGLIGAALGVFVVVGVSIIQQWTPILDLRIAFGSALLGGVIGLLAGAYPALKAAALEPVAALRGGL